MESTHSLLVEIDIHVWPGQCPIFNFKRQLPGEIFRHEKNKVEKKHLIGCVRTSVCAGG